MAQNGDRRQRRPILRTPTLQPRALSQREADSEQLRLTNEYDNFDTITILLSTTTVLIKLF